jgi:ribosomal-protein-alanine N-acetyltransferase
VATQIRFEYARGVGRDIEIRTARLLLRAFRTEDVEDALAYRDDAEFAQFLPHIPRPFTRADAEAFVATNMNEPWESLPTFAVVLDDRVIGTVNFHVDPAGRSAMIGYAIARAHWGRGLVVEAATAAMAWAFAEHDLVEIWASTDVAHARSRRVMEKLGMTLERADEREVVYRLRRESA